MTIIKVDHMYIKKDNNKVLIEDNDNNNNKFVRCVLDDKS